MLVDKTQPVRHTGPRWAFGRGLHLTHCIGTTYAWVDSLGFHRDYVEAEVVEIEPTLQAEQTKQRSYRQ